MHTPTSRKMTSSMVEEVVVDSVMVAPESPGGSKDPSPPSLPPPSPPSDPPPNPLVPPPRPEDNMAELEIQDVFATQLQLCFGHHFARAGEGKEERKEEARGG